MDPLEIVTLVVRHRVRAGREMAYEQWLQRTTRVASTYPGHLGVDVICEQGQFICVLRFSGASELQAWLGSGERQQLIEEVSPLLVEGDQTQVHIGHEFWFNPHHPKQPPRWKQACVTFLVILPLSLLIPLLWQPLFAKLPVLSGYVASNVLITLTIVLLVVYLFMPKATQLFAAWLEPRGHDS
ncbi:antibiotic biosynthesis monooxygenase [Pseudomonas sp. NPDC089554]|uniref:antibiotic biosynthesis monooxygenase n=1 Tax=Pseudomonas sp. NPDC089554 TaxID=3390653 RepID=UPI003D05CE2C